MKKKNVLSEKQQRIYDYICEYIEINHISPTVREICLGADIKSTSTAHNNLTALSELGLIIYKKSVRRSITVLSKNDKPSGGTNVPLVGNVAAGIPIHASENVLTSYSLPPEMLHGASDNEVFMLKIKGESMIEAGILDGDMIIVHKTLHVDNGDIAVVRVNDDEVTCKRLYREKNHIRLQPENSSMEPIIVLPTDSIVIVGKVVGVIRCL